MVYFVTLWDDRGKSALSILKSFVSLFPGGKNLARRYSNYRRGRKLEKLGDTEDRFTHIYKDNAWRDSESASGSGSSLDSTENIRAEIPHLLEGFGVAKMLDAPCGDYNWFQIVSVSGHGLQAAPSKPKENTYRRISVLHAAGKHDEVIKLADRLLKIAPGNADARDLLGESLFQAAEEPKEMWLLENAKHIESTIDIKTRKRLVSYMDEKLNLDRNIETVNK